ncbi:MAG TPA: serine hydrolase domain-containing protein [Ktedonobacteraceae bacterium]
MMIRLYRSALRGVFCSLLLLLALLFTMLPVAAAQSAAGVAPLPTQNFASIDAFVSSQMQANRIPGLSLGIVHGNRIIHLQGFGAADATGRMVTPQTPFILGSISKSFTALAVTQLVEAGKVELDAPVQRYLPWFRVADPAASAHITVRQLLNQTSGIPANSENEQKEGFLSTGNETLEQYVRGLKTLALDRPVGASFEYANTNYSVLGLIVQTVSGQSYETYMQQHIFAPLQMSHSFASEQDARRDGLAQGYQLWFGLPVPTAQSYPRDLLPAGLLISTAEDMAHYLIAQMNGGRFEHTAVLSAAGIAKLHAPAVTASPDTSYGMGWYNGPINGVPTIWHEGSSVNFSSDMILVPESQWGIVVLSNENGLPAELTGSVGNIAGGVLNMLVGRKLPPAGLSVSTLYLMLDSLLVLISALALWSALRLPRWYEQFGRRWRQPGRLKRGFNIVRLGVRLVWELILPALVLGLPILIGSLTWRTLLLTAPDIVWWLLVISALMFITAIIRLVLMIRVLRGASVDRPAVTPSPVPNLT